MADEIHFRPPLTPAKDIMGGAGTYSALGARLLSAPPHSKRVGWIVDAGSDFPPQLRREIAAWDTSCLIRETPMRLTTRGWNGYGENEHRCTGPESALTDEGMTYLLLLVKILINPEKFP